MLIDLHAHYPMQVLGEPSDRTLKELRRVRGRPTVADRLRAVVLRVASTFFSNANPFSGYRVTAEGLREGGVGVALSVLTRPFDEVALGRPYPAQPEGRYFAGLLEDLDRVEAHVRREDPARLRLVHSRAELRAARAAGATALVHCVEGGFSLGDTAGEVRRNVAELARRGVVYITVAHLLFRHVATSCNALPFLSEAWYRRLFPQPDGPGLTPRGVAALEAMVEHRVLLDIAHMRRDALDEAFALLDRLDPAGEVPVLATHNGYRFGEQEYMLDARTIERIGRRNGVIGLILAQHQLNDGVREKRTRTFDDSLAVIFAHVDRIAELTGGLGHVAIGTDFDGFIKPTLTGLEGSADLARLEAALRERYGKDAEGILSGNVARVLDYVWR